MDQPRRTQAGQTGFLGHTPPTGGRPHNPAFTAGLMQAALQARKVMGIVTPLHDGYQVQTFHCSLAFGAGGGDKLRRLATELANAAGVPWCRISPYWDGHLIEIPKRAEDRRLLDPRALLEHEPPSRWHVPVGMGVTGEVVWHDLASPNMAHMVVGGESGSGKTVALHWLLFCLLSRNTPRQLQLLLCDPKLGELLPFQRVAHLVHPVEHRPREIAKLLEWAKAQMDERRAQVGDLDWRPSSRLLIVIDELRHLAKQDRRILAAVDDIAMLGRSLGVHLIITAQHPNGAWYQNWREYPKPPSIADFPVVPASYPESWSRKWLNDWPGRYYLNDDVLMDMVDVMLDAYDAYGDERYRQSALKGGDFLLLAQMPDPQPAWAQQYDPQMRPCWDRKFEPPAISGRESQDAMLCLLKLHRRSGEGRYLAPIPRAIAYLRSSLLPDGRLARFYELQTNKPLYFDREYQLTYDPAQSPEHYGFTWESHLDDIEAAYNRAVAGEPQPGPDAAALAAQVREAIDTMDARGAWVVEGLELDAHDMEPASGVILSQTFIDNVELLCAYVAALD